MNAADNGFTQCCRDVPVERLTVFAMTYNLSLSPVFPVEIQNRCIWKRRWVSIRS
jgi:hypothetical protein